MNEWVQVIQAVGFPIVCCAMLMWYIVHRQDDMRDVLERNTIATEKLCQVCNQLSHKLGDENEDDDVQR